MCFGGGSSGAVDQEAVVKNREIEKTIKADQKRAAREVKLLLLGEHSQLPVPSLQSQFQSP
jgi:guanine nucleotide-binding protein subunit alpha